jgi:hypothetical protein
VRVSVPVLWTLASGDPARDLARLRLISAALRDRSGSA